MRARLIVPWVGACLCLILPASAAFGDVSPASIESLFRTLDAATATDAPRVMQTSEGALRYLGAPRGATFRGGTGGLKSSGADAAAKAFLDTYSEAFGISSDSVAFRTERVTPSDLGSNVRLQQTYGGLDVFCGQVVVQVTDAGVESVLSDILRNTSDLDGGKISLTPSVTAALARAAGIEEVALQSPIHDAAELRVLADPVLMIYDPAVLGIAGKIRLVWKMLVECPADPMVQEVILVDAHTKAIALHYSNAHDAKYREIYDANNTYDDPGTLARKEGDTLAAVGEVNLAYDYFGDTYDFYWNHHGRDSIDNLGMTLSATVRACDMYYPVCPYPNAFWEPEKLRMYFGDGFIVDDVVGHELTHGVTQFSSGLIYLGESGAINEAFSDIWGEFIDLTNGRGTDTPEVRWLCGEDLPVGLSYGDEVGLRNMADPPEFGDPDRMGSPYWIPPDWIWYDNGGVHINSGVLNKMCYLLTDGHSFNGYDIQPLAEDSDESIDRVAKLFYELQVDLLTPASDFHDVYMQLAQASLDQSYTEAERLNVRDAARAVEIEPETIESMAEFRATPAYTTAGNPVIALKWRNPNNFAYAGVTLVRNAERFPEDETDGVVIYEGPADRALDANVVKNTEYFYGLFADMGEAKPKSLFVRTFAGVDPPDTLAEAFDFDLFGLNEEAGTAAKLDIEGFVDLSFVQLTFTPVGPSLYPFGSEEFYTDYFQYEATRSNVIALPVPREDADGASFQLALEDNKTLTVPLSDPFPFFGGRYYSLVLGSNGYIAFEPVGSTDTKNFPSLAAHFAIPRISFLFANLSPATGGEVWMRDFDDRLVITFENVPEYLPPDAAMSGLWPNAPWPNTAQIELFTNGKIRITYLEVNAMNIVCGLSDGRGVPTDPADLFPGLIPDDSMTDLTGLPVQASRLSLAPLPIFNSLAGDLLSFTATTDPPWLAGTPALTAQWDGPVLPPFADNHNGTGLFYWTPALGEYDDVYTLRITATLGDQVAYQDVRIHIGDPNPLPVAKNVRLSTGLPFDAPDQNRAVPVDAPLFATYEYYHPLAEANPDSYGEGLPILYWYKNNGLVPAFTNNPRVPPAVTVSGDRWFFSVVPRTKLGVRGKEVYSPIVTVQELPTLTGIVPARGPASGGTADSLVTLTGTRLDVPTDVRFGGIRAQEIRSISDTEIQVIAPAHAPGIVDVLVTTASGSVPAMLVGGYQYLNNGVVITKADINNDSAVNALDVQLVINAVLERTKDTFDADANRDGAVNAVDIQTVVNVVLGP